MLNAPFRPRRGVGSPCMDPDQAAPTRRPDVLRRDCIACGSDDLEVVLRLSGPERPDDIAWTRVSLVRCRACFLVYLESHEHDGWNGNRLDERPDYHEWYEFPRERGPMFVPLVARACPAPQDARCECALHEALREDLRCLPLAPDFIPATFPEYAGRPGPNIHTADASLVAGVARLKPTCVRSHPWDLYRPGMAPPDFPGTIIT